MPDSKKYSISTPYSKGSAHDSNIQTSSNSTAKLSFEKQKLEALKFVIINYLSTIKEYVTKQFLSEQTISQDNKKLNHFLLLLFQQFIQSSVDSERTAKKQIRETIREFTGLNGDLLYTTTKYCLEEFVKIEKLFTENREEKNFRDILLSHFNQNEKEEILDFIKNNNLTTHNKVVSFIQNQGFNNHSEILLTLKNIQNSYDFKQIIHAIESKVDALNQTIHIISALEKVHYAYDLIHLFGDREEFINFLYQEVIMIDEDILDLALDTISKLTFVNPNHLEVPQSVRPEQWQLALHLVKRQIEIETKSSSIFISHAGAPVATAIAFSSSFPNISLQQTTEPKQNLPTIQNESSTINCDIKETIQKYLGDCELDSILKAHEETQNQYYFVFNDHSSLFKMPFQIYKPLQIYKHQNSINYRLSLEILPTNTSLEKWITRITTQDISDTIHMPNEFDINLAILSQYLIRKAKLIKNIKQYTETIPYMILGKSELTKQYALILFLITYIPEKNHFNYKVKVIHTDRSDLPVLDKKIDDFKKLYNSSNLVQKLFLTDNTHLSGMHFLNSLIKQTDTKLVANQSNDQAFLSPATIYRSIKTLINKVTTENLPTEFHRKSFFKQLSAIENRIHWAYHFHPKGKYLDCNFLSLNSKLKEALAEITKNKDIKTSFQFYPFSQRNVSSSLYRGLPIADPIELKKIIIKNELFNNFGQTTYGGNGSKYKVINEDSIFSSVSSDGIGCFGVIDGSGGSANGFLAGMLANEQLFTQLKSGIGIEDAFTITHNNIKKNIPGAYATAAIVKINNHQLVGGAVGDTKILTIRNRKIFTEGTTIPHSKVRFLIDRGDLPAEAIHTSPIINQITQAIGSTTNKDLNISKIKFKVQPKDIIIIASDGVFDLVSDYEILQWSKTHFGESLEDKIFKTAFDRNNSLKPFTIQFSKDQVLEMKAKFGVGDNISLQVIEIL